MSSEEPWEFQEPEFTDEEMLVWEMSSHGFTKIHTMDKGDTLHSWTFANAERDNDTVTITRSLRDLHFPWAFIRPATGQARYALETVALHRLIEDIQQKGVQSWRPTRTPTR